MAKQQPAPRPPRAPKNAPTPAPTARKKATPKKRSAKPKQPPQKQPEPRGVERFYVATAAEVAREFEVERSTVHSWKSKGMPGVDGAYSIIAITRWLLIDGPWRSEKYRQAVLQHAIDK